jgi:hypothetical protein
VKIPPGIADGQRLRISGEGEGGLAGGPPGDLYVFIEVAEHAFFRRDGNNLSCEIPVNFTTLALGGHVQVPTLDGEEPFKIPDGTQSGTVFRLRGKGIPDVSGRGRGDLFFTVQAVTPKKLTKEQRSLLEQLSKALPKEEFEPRAESRQVEKNIFNKVKTFLDKAWPRSRFTFGLRSQLQELVLAELDDFQPTAIQNTKTSHGYGRFSRHPSGVTARARALAEFGTHLFVESLEVADEDWAARSQAQLRAITIGRTVAPPWAAGGLRPAHRNRETLDGGRHGTSRDDAADAEGVAGDTAPWSPRARHRLRIWRARARRRQARGDVRRRRRHRSRCARERHRKSRAE